MTERRHWLAVGAVSLFGVALIPLLWTYQWATTNNSAADLEHEEFIEAALIASAVLAAVSLIAHVAAADRQSTPLVIAKGGTTGALITVAVAAASALLLAIVLEWKVGKGDVDSGVFAAISAAFIAISGGLGVTTAWLLDDAATASRTVAGGIIVLALAFVAGLYMAEDAIRLNQCVVGIEFPVESDQGECSGY